MSRRFQFSLAYLMATVVVWAVSAWMYRTLWRTEAVAALAAGVFALGAFAVLYAARSIEGGCDSAWPVLIALLGILIVAASLGSVGAVAASLGWKW
jgi:hypothetical protein